MHAVCHSNERKLKRRSKYLHVKFISWDYSGAKKTWRETSWRFLMLIALLAIPRSRLFLLHFGVLSFWMRLQFRKTQKSRTYFAPSEPLKIWHLFVTKYRESNIQSPFIVHVQEKASIKDNLSCPKSEI